MSTVIELSEQELAQLKSLTQQSDAAAAVRAAVMEYLRYACRQRLKELSGRVEMADDWAKLENAELETSDEPPRSDSH